MNETKAILKANMLKILKQSIKHIAEIANPKSIEDLIFDKYFWGIFSKTTCKISVFTKQIHTFTAYDVVKQWLNFLTSYVAENEEFNIQLYKIVSQQIFADIKAEDAVPIWCKKVYIDFLFENGSVNLNSLRKVLKIMWNAPNFETQKIFMNTVLDRSDQDDIHEIFGEYFKENIALKKLFDDIYIEDDRSLAVRKFLNKINASKDPVEISSFEALEIRLNNFILIKNVWINFNFSVKTISFECPRIFLSSNESESDIFEDSSDIITMKASSVSSVQTESISENDFEGHKLKLKFEEPCSAIYETSINYLKHYRTISFIFDSNIEYAQEFISKFFSNNQSDSTVSIVFSSESQCSEINRSEDKRDGNEDNIINSSIENDQKLIRTANKRLMNKIIDEIYPIIEENDTIYSLTQKMSLPPKPTSPNIVISTTPDDSEIENKDFALSYNRPIISGTSQLPPSVGTTQASNNILNEIIDLTSISPIHPDEAPEKQLLFNENNDINCNTLRVKDVNDLLENTSQQTVNLSQKSSGSSKGRKRRPKKKIVDDEEEYDNSSFFSQGESAEKYTRTRTRDVRKPDHLQYYTDSECSTRKRKRASSVVDEPFVKRIKTILPVRRPTESMSASQTEEKPNNISLVSKTKKRLINNINITEHLLQEGSNLVFRLPIEEKLPNLNSKSKNLAENSNQKTIYVNTPIEDSSVEVSQKTSEPSENCHAHQRIIPVSQIQAELNSQHSAARQMDRFDMLKNNLLTSETTTDRRRICFFSSSSSQGSEHGNELEPPTRELEIAPSENITKAKTTCSCGNGAEYINIMIESCEDIFKHLTQELLLKAKATREERIKLYRSLSNSFKNLENEERRKS